MEGKPRSSHQRGLLELVLQAQQGSPEAWEKLFQAMEKVVRRRCLLHKPQVLKHRVTDSDVLQEVALRASQSLGQFRGKTPQEFVIWLTAITENLINDYYREYQSAKKGASKELSLEGLEERGEQVPGPAGPRLDEESVARAREALAQLEEPYHRAIEWRIEEGLSFREIGARLECSQDAARMMYHRAVHIVREKITGAK